MYYYFKGGKFMMEIYYSVLGLKTTATRDEITKRYRELLEICDSLPKKERTEIFSGITEAYFTIMSTMGKDSVEKKVRFSLQREPISARIAKAFNFKGVQRAIAGLAASVMLFSFTTGCVETGNIRDGYSYTDYYYDLSEIEDTKNYFLIKINNKIFLTKAQSSLEYISFEDYTIKTNLYRYYDIVCANGTQNNLGIVSFIHKVTKNNDTVEFVESYPIGDFGICQGRYGIGYNLPNSAIVSLTNFVTSTKPTSGDIAFWSSNSEAVHRAFDELVLNDLETTFEINSSETGKTVALLKSFECTSKNGSIETFVGYRASENERDIGYNYVYNVFDGTIHYIGIASENAYASVKENKIEGGKTISELRELFGVEFTYVQEPTSEPPVETEVIATEEPQVTEPVETKEPITSEEPVADSIDSRVTFKDVWVIDFNNPKLYDYLSGDDIPTDLNALIYFNSQGLHNVVGGSYYDSVYDDKNDIIRIANYHGTYGNFSASAKDESGIPGLITLDEFLASIGREDEIRDAYTKADLDRLFVELNPNLGNLEFTEDNILIVETGELGLSKYSIFSRESNEESFADIEDYNIKGHGGFFESITVYTSRDDKTGTELNCGSLNDFLLANGLESLIKDKYTITELHDIFEMINGLNKEKEADKRLELK